MSIEDLVDKWFECWDTGSYREIPVASGFAHTSPYGTISGRDEYLAVVAENEEKFLGTRIEIHDRIFEDTRAAVRYTVSKDDFSMEVSEWIYAEGGEISKIISYYNIPGEIREDRKLAEPGD